MRNTQRLSDWLGTPLHTASRQTRATLVGVCVLLTASWSGWVQHGMEPPFSMSDVEAYVSMAQGRFASVHQPFASRPLAPLMARALAAGLHQSIQHGFLILGWIAFLFTLAVVFFFAVGSSLPRWMLPMLVTLSFWPGLLHAFPMPDLPYAALLCCLLLCLFRRHYWLAALSLFPLMLARESTMLVLFCLLGAAWQELRPWGALLALASTLAGAVMVRHLSAGAASNVEHLPSVVYMAAKVPWNLLRTLGIVPWSNLFPYLCGTPARAYALHLGPLQSVGLCGVSSSSPFFACFALFTIFGLLPSLVVIFLFDRSRWQRLPPMERFCVVYGGIAFLLAPALGTGYERLFGYGWPLFLVALPRLCSVQADKEIGDPAMRGDALFWLLPLGCQIALCCLALLPPRPELLLACGVLQLVGTLALVQGDRQGKRRSEGGLAPPSAW